VSLLRDGIDLPFTNGFYQSRSLGLSAQQCINYRANISPVGALSAESLYQTEGIKGIIDSPGSVTCRGSHTMNSIPYEVSGNTLYRIDRTVNPDLTEVYTRVNLGTIEGSGRVIMASIWSSTGYEMAIVVPGQFAYYYTESGGTVESLIGLTNFDNPVNDVISINGFCVFLETGTNRVFHSNLNNVASYNALDFELITRTPKVIGLISFRGQMFIMGEDQILPYTFVGGSNFVFQYQPNSSIPSGLNSLHAKAITRQSFCYLGGGKNETPAVWLSTGTYPQRISNDAIEYLIRDINILDQAYIMYFAIDGGEFIALKVGGYCFVYDLLTGRWHQRRSSVGDNEVAWRVSSITKAYGKLIVGDDIDGRTGYLSNDNTEYGVNVRRSFIMQPFDNRGRHVSLKSLVLAMDTGYDGDMVLEWSDDDGHTWSDGLQRGAGGIGDYGRHVRWDRLGSSAYSRTLRFGTSSDSKVNVNKVIALP